MACSVVRPYLCPVPGAGCHNYRIKQGGLPFAWQAVEPFTISMVAVWLCWVVLRNVSHPAASKLLCEVSPPEPQLTHRFGMDGSGEVAAEVAEAEPSRGFRLATPWACGCAEGHAPCSDRKLGNL